MKELSSKKKNDLSIKTATQCIIKKGPGLHRHGRLLSVREGRHIVQHQDRHPVCRQGRHWLHRQGRDSLCELSKQPNSLNVPQFKSEINIYYLF